MIRKVKIGIGLHNRMFCEVHEDIEPTYVICAFELTQKCSPDCAACCITLGKDTFPRRTFSMAHCQRGDIDIGEIIPREE